MTTAQKEILLGYLKAFMADPHTANEGESEKFESFDKKRIASLPTLSG